MTGAPVGLLTCETPRKPAVLAFLPRAVESRATAGRPDYKLLKDNPSHPSLHFKKVGQFWSVRVGLHDRAIAVDAVTDLVWFWIGSHADYDRLLGRDPAKRRPHPTATKTRDNTRKRAGRKR